MSRESTQQRLFTATLRLIGTRGVVGLTVDEIAAEAGVAKGTVYYNFGSKDGLIDALLRHGVDLLASRVEGARGVEQLVDSLLGFYAAYPTFAQLLVSELWRTPSQWRATLTLVRERVTGLIRGRFQELADAGRLPEGVGVETAASALFGTVLVVALDWQVFSPSRSLEEVRESVLGVVRGASGA